MRGFNMQFLFIMGLLGYLIFSPILHAQSMTETNTNATNTEASAMERDLGRPLKVNMVQKDFAEVVAFFDSTFNTPVVVNWKALKTAGIDETSRVNYVNKSPIPAVAAFSELLSIFSEQMPEEIRLTIQGGVILVTSTRDRLRRQRYLEDGTDATQRMMRYMGGADVEVKIDAKNAIEAFESFSKASRVFVVVNDRALKAAGVVEGPVQINMKGRPAMILELICELVEGDQGKLAVTMMHGSAVISTVEELSRSKIFRSDQSPASHGAFRSMITPLKINGNVKLETMLMVFDEKFGVTTEVDWAALNGQGATKETIVEMNTPRMAGDALLRLVMSRVGDDLSYALIDGKLYISSKAGILSRLGEPLKTSGSTSAPTE